MAGGCYEDNLCWKMGGTGRRGWTPRYLQERDELQNEVQALEQAARKDKEDKVALDTQLRAAWKNPKKPSEKMAAKAARMADVRGASEETVRKMVRLAIKTKWREDRVGDRGRADRSRRSGKTLKNMV